MGSVSAMRSGSTELGVGRSTDVYRYLISLFGFNIPRHALELYFGEPWR